MIAAQNYVRHLSLFELGRHGNSLIISMSSLILIMTGDDLTVS